jgi:hypothetical protein
MGFLDKMKETVGDMGKTINGTIDTQKTELKIKDEERNLVVIEKEIGHIIATNLHKGLEYDPSWIDEQMLKYEESCRRINEYRLMNGETIEDDSAGYVSPVEEADSYVASVPVPQEPEPVQEPIQEPVPAVEEPQAQYEPEPAVQEPQYEPEPVQAVRNDSDSEWKSLDGEGWVEMKEEVFWTEDASEPAPQAPVQEPEPVVEEPQSSGAKKDPDAFPPQARTAPPREEPDADSPLARMSSYKSNNFAGKM